MAGERMNQLEQLKQELKEKEKELKFKSLFKDCPECGYNCEKEKVRAEISSLKKGISACEEILNSQQNKMTSNQGMVSNPDLTEVNRTTGSADTEQEKAEGVVYPKGDSDTSPVQTLIKQALSQRNKEILEIIDKLKIKHTKEHRGCGDPSECCFNGLDVLDWDFFEDLKEQLTEGEGKE